MGNRLRPLLSAVVVLVLLAAAGFYATRDRAVDDGVDGVLYERSLGTRRAGDVRLAVDAAGLIHVATPARRPSGGPRLITVCLDGRGQVRWEASEPASALAMDAFDLVVPAPERTVVVTRGTDDEGTPRFAVVAYDATGRNAWRAAVPAPAPDLPGNARLAVLPAGGVAVAAVSDDGLVVACFAGDGKEVWRQTLPTDEGRRVTKALLAVAGKELVALAVSLTPTGERARLHFVESGAPGRVRLSETVDAGEGLEFVDLAATPDGGAVVLGTRSMVDERGNTGHTLVVVGLDNRGKQRWRDTYVGPAKTRDLATAVAVDGAGNVRVAGSGVGGATDVDFVALSYTADGARQWVARYDGDAHSYDYAAALALDADGRIAVTGRSFGGTEQNDDVAVVVWDAAGERVAQARYAGPERGIERGRAVAFAPDGGVIVAGHRDAGRPQLVVWRYGFGR